MTACWLMRPLKGGVLHSVTAVSATLLRCGAARCRCQEPRASEDDLEKIGEAGRSLAVEKVCSHTLQASLRVKCDLTGPACKACGMSVRKVGIYSSIVPLKQIEYRPASIAITSPYKSIFYLLKGEYRLSGAPRWDRPSTNALNSFIIPFYESTVGGYIPGIYKVI